MCADPTRMQWFTELAHLEGLGHDPSSGLPYVRPIPGAEPLLVVPIAKPGEPE
jgi:hypothetical protein